MEPDKDLQLPFLQRKMLNFEHGLVFQLRIQSQSDLAQELTIRGATREGIFTFKHTPTADGLVKTETFEIPDIPIFVSVIDEGANFLQGRCFITLSLVTNGDLLYQLTAGFVYKEKAISWPNAISNDSVPGRGRVKIVNGNNPVAGNDASDSIPTGRMWHILAYTITLVASAAAANRIVSLRLGSTGRTISSVTQVANETKIYHFNQYGVLPAVSGQNRILVPLPTNLYLPAGEAIETATEAMAAGDDFGAPTILVEEFFT